MAGIGAPFGNQHAKKLDTPELRTQAFDSYCKHLASGDSKETWCFEHPYLTLTWNTMEKYIKENPIEFDSDKKELAEIKGRAYWESIVKESANGKNRKANTATLQMAMRNKYKWDRPTYNAENVNESFVQAHANLINQLANQQKAAQEEAN